MNLAILKGHVGGDPKTTSFEDGGKVVTFSLATTERGFTTKDGREVKERTEWHNIVVRKNGLAGVVEKYVKKGSPLLIQGRIETRKYLDNEGKNRYVTEIIAEELELLASGEKTEKKPNHQYKPMDYPD